MAPSEQLPYVAVEEEDYSENEGSEYEDSNDSQDDPTYDIFEETQSGFSNLSIEKKSKSRIKKEMDLGCVIDLDEVEIVAPVLDKKDEKSFEMVQKMVEAGQLEKLKVDQCKVYLRKNGLRLTGNKDTLVQRIKEHLDIINGGGEKKYPVSSFVLNCKGDACMGDVVMFEQNVYEMFNIASRSASGPPCGSRIVAGRIVKESYGAAKQQHTFTIEVLWSKGKKPLPPLHPLLIKGRNLYRLETLRQRWEDERERQRVLMEKHSRGSLARSNREARIQEKEMRKNNRHLKVTRKAELKNTKSQSNQTKSGLSVDSGKLVQSPTQQFPPLQRENLCPNSCKENIGFPLNMLKFPQEMHHNKHDGHPKHNRGSLARSDREARIQEKEMRKNNRQSNQTKSGLSVDSGKLVRPPTQQFPPLQRENLCPNTCEENIGFPQEMHHNKHDGHPRLDSSHIRGGSFANNHCHREPLRSMNKYASRLDSSHIRGGSFANNHCHREPLRSMNKYASRPDSSHIRGGSFANNHRHREPLRSMNKYDSWGYPPLSSSWGHSHKQVCRHYAKGRCHFGYNCNFLHDFR